MMPDYPLEQTLDFKFTTRAFATGISTTLAGTPVIEIYEDNLTTQITGAETLTVDFDGVTGLNNLRVVATAANGFEAGKSYAAVISAGTVDGVSVVGEVVTQFSIERSSSALSVSALANLQLMYDGTGYTDATAPSSRSQLDQITISGSAVNVGARAAPNGFVLTTGSEVNDEDSTQALDGVYHELTDAAGVLDGLYKFDIGGDGIPVGLKITGIFNGNNDSWDISANTGTDATPVFQQVGQIIGTNSASNVVHSFDLLAGQIVSDVVGEVQIRINGTGLTSSSFDVDQIIVSKSVIVRTTGYANGQIWINTALSNTNTEAFVDGTADNPVSTLAAALTLSGNVNLTDFHIINGSSLTFVSAATDFSFFGDNWTLALGGQNIDGLHVEGAVVSGIGVGTGSDVTFIDCHIATATLPDRTTIRISSLEGAILTVPAGDIFLHQCYMGTPAGVVPVIDLGAAVANSEVHMHDWRGRVEFRNLGQLGTDNIHLDGQGKVTFNANCVGGTIFWRGAFEITNNGSGITINDDARYDQAQIADAVLPTQNAPFSFQFVFVASSDHVTPVTAASGTVVERSIDGGAYGIGTGTLTEIGDGSYRYAASAADMDGGDITFRLTGTGGNPTRPDASFVHIITTGGV